MPVMRTFKFSFYLSTVQSGRPRTGANYEAEQSLHVHLSSFNARHRISVSLSFAAHRSLKTLSCSLSSRFHGVQVLLATKAFVLSAGSFIGPRGSYRSLCYLYIEC